MRGLFSRSRTKSMGGGSDDSPAPTASSPPNSRPVQAATASIPIAAGRREAPPPSFEATSAEPPSYLTASSPPSVSHISRSAPVTGLPCYSPGLQTNELRLISTIVDADAGRSRHTSDEIVVPQSTKRLKVTLTRGGYRMISYSELQAQLQAQETRRNSTSSVQMSTVRTGAGSPREIPPEASDDSSTPPRPTTPPRPIERTGPVVIRVGRRGEIAGRITLNLKAKGERDRIDSIEVGIYGTTTNSMFIRGQYSLLDAVPILKKMERLWPPPDGDGESTELEDGQTFNFSLTMPTQYPTNPAMDLPPSVSVAQFALQSEVTYWFKIRMKRKGWRLNDDIAIPLLYEPRGWISPRRVSLLTVEDLMNPGWRTVKLRGGGERCQPPGTEGVVGTILMPSPAILVIDPARLTAPADLTIHVHLHSTLPLPLATFANTSLSDWKIRFIRAVTMNVHGQNEVRHTILPSTVELRDSNGQVIPLDGGIGANATSPRIRPRRRSSFAETVNLALHRESSRLHDSDATPLLETAIEEDEVERDVSPAIPLDSTDVHFTATVALDFKSPSSRLNGPFVPSFISPELAVGYLILVSIMPKAGAVKERFTHIEGGGQVEIVLGRREVVVDEEGTQ